MCMCTSHDSLCSSSVMRSGLHWHVKHMTVSPFDKVPNVFATRLLCDCHRCVYTAKQRCLAILEILACARRMAGSGFWELPNEEDDAVFDGSIDAALDAPPARSLRRHRSVEERLCWLCDEPMSEANSSSRGLTSGKPCHKACYNGVHALYRISVDSPALKATIQQLKTTDMDQFKKMCRALVTHTGRSRTAEDRNKALSFISEFVSEKTYRKKTGMLMRSPRQFLSWMMYREGLSADEAAAAWAAALADPNTLREEVDGKVVVAVEQPEERSYIQSVGKRQKLCETTDVDESSATELRAKVKAFGPELSAFGAQANFVKEGASRSIAGGLPAASSSGRHAAATMGSCTSQLAAAPTAVSPPRGTQAAPQPSPAGAPAPLAAPSPAAVVEATGGAGMFEDILQEGEKVTMVKFMHVKQSIKHVLTGALGNYAVDRKSPIAQLRDLLKRDQRLVTDPEVEGVDPEAACSEMDKHVAALKKNSRRVRMETSDHQDQLVVR